MTLCASCIPDLISAIALAVTIGVGVPGDLAGGVEKGRVIQFFPPLEVLVVVEEVVAALAPGAGV